MRRPDTTFRRQPSDVLRRRLNRLAVEAQSHRADAAVERVLMLLSDDNLAEEAAKAQKSGELVLECGVLDRVWDDPRVFNRRNQLQRQGITVELVPVETTVADRTFHRTRLKVTF